MVLVRYLLAAAVAACLRDASAVPELEATYHCDPGQAGCEANAAGDESELLQVKIRGHESWYRFDQDQARALAPLVKLTYCSALPGTAGSAGKLCGSQGYCKGAGVKIKNGSVHTLSLTDEDSPRAVVAFTGQLQSIPGSENHWEPACMAAVRGTWPHTNNLERGYEEDMVPLDYGAAGACKDCRAHEGYQKIWKVLKPELVSTLESQGCLKSTPLYLTGHSLGGAVATLGMIELKLDGWNVQHSYVFHNPRVGNAAFVKYFNKVLTGSEVGAAVTRITHAKDNIPTWPWDQQSDGSYYAYTWPEVHYRIVGNEYKYEVCMHETTDCGTLSEGALCGMTECDDHVENPIAPNNNFVIPLDHKAMCLLGQGEAEAEDEVDLPEPVRRHEPSDDQFEWMWKRCER